MFRNFGKLYERLTFVQLKDIYENKIIHCITRGKSLNLKEKLNNVSVSKLYFEYKSE